MQDHLTKPVVGGLAPSVPQKLIAHGRLGGCRASFPSVLRGQSKQPINAVIIGVGGRGGGAGGTSSMPPKPWAWTAKIVAVADIFPEAAKKARRDLRRARGQMLQRFRCLS